MWPQFADPWHAARSETKITVCVFNSFPALHLLSHPSGLLQRERLGVSPPLGRSVLSRVFHLGVLLRLWGKVRYMQWERKRLSAEWSVFMHKNCHFCKIKRHKSVDNKLHKNFLSTCHFSPCYSGLILKCFRNNCKF